MLRKKYSKQIHISFLTDKSSGPHLLDRVLKKHSTEMELISLNIVESKSTHSGSKLSVLSELDGNSRLYINGHGSFDDPDHITDDNGKKLHYKDLAMILSEKLTSDDFKDKHKKPRLKISLVMCESAAFGEKLHYELSKYGIYCDVVARTRVTSVTITDDIRKGEKKTLPHDLDEKKYHEIRLAQLSKDKTEKTWGIFEGNKLGVRQQPGSKVVFCWNDQNRQVMKHAYDGLFKRKVIESLNKQLENASPKEEFEKLIELIDSLQNDLLIKEALEDCIKRSPHMNMVIRSTMQKLIYDYDEGKNLLSHAKDNFRIVVNSEIPLFRIFYNENYTREELLEKKIIEGIICCRDEMAHPKERLLGIDRLLNDISEAGSIKNKLNILDHALNTKLDPYQINKFDEGIFQLTFSLSPTLTKAYTALKTVYTTCSKEYDSLIHGKTA